MSCLSKSLIGRLILLGDVTPRLHSGRELLCRGESIQPLSDVPECAAIVVRGLPDGAFVFGDRGAVCRGQVEVTVVLRIDGVSEAGGRTKKQQKRCGSGSIDSTHCAENRTTTAIDDGLAKYYRK